MTHIVYDGHSFVIDRKVYKGTGTTRPREQRKVQHLNTGTEHWFWAVSGSVIECNVLDEIIRSYFNSIVIENETKKLVGRKDCDRDMFFCLLIKAPYKENGGVPKVFEVNYFGDVIEYDPPPYGHCFAVGAMRSEIECAYRTVRALRCDHSLEMIVRAALSHTDYDQTGWALDVINPIQPSDFSLDPKLITPEPVQEDLEGIPNGN